MSINININDALGLAAAAADSRATSPSGGATATNTEVNKDAFLTLLVEQLKHQDPLAPQDGAQFIAQLAQFNSLEQLISINERLGQMVK